MNQNNTKEEKVRHETLLTKTELTEYEQACKEVDRSPRKQTAFLIRQFLKRVTKNK